MKNFRYDPRLYDLQINWKARLDSEVELLAGIIEEYDVGRVLDIGCGTAHHLQALSDYADQLIGIDPLPDTIEYARKNVIKAGNVCLRVGGFEDLNNMDIQDFDLIMSLGNTLPLLGSRRKVKLALKHCRKKLTRGGVALFQFLNFNKSIIEENCYYQPKVVMEGQNQYIFLKHFEYGRVKTRADFIITEIGPQKEVTRFGVNSSWMCTLKKNLFLSMARNQGYSKIRLLGPSGKKEFDYGRDISLYAILNK